MAKVRVIGRIKTKSSSTNMTNSQVAGIFLYV